LSCSLSLSILEFKMWAVFLETKFLCLQGPFQLQLFPGKNERSTDLHYRGESTVGSKSFVDAYSDCRKMTRTWPGPSILKRRRWETFKRFRLRTKKEIQEIVNPWVYLFGIESTCKHWLLSYKILPTWIYLRRLPSGSTTSTTNLTHYSHLSRFQKDNFPAEQHLTLLVIPHSLAKCARLGIKFQS